MATIIGDSIMYGIDEGIIYVIVVIHKSRAKIKSVYLLLKQLITNLFIQ